MTHVEKLSQFPVVQVQEGNTRIGRIEAILQIQTCLT